MKFTISNIHIKKKHFNLALNDRGKKKSISIMWSWSENMSTNCGTATLVPSPTVPLSDSTGASYSIATNSSISSAFFCSSADLRGVENY